MNYRHAFHAGNFADVLKHAVLCRILVHLRTKPAAFRVIDTHAGAGRYELTGAEAAKTGEWRDGIARLIHARLTLPVQALLAPYLDAVAALNRDGGLTVYPGSPALVQSLMRRQDRLIACELEPRAAAALAALVRGDRRAKAIAIDGWTALAAYVPPKERRGLVLIDPPFERPDEYAHLVETLEVAHRKWPTGSYLLWYPIKDLSAVAGMIRKLVRSGIDRILRIELMPAPAASGTLRGCGLIAVNPPWTLHGELQLLLPALAEVLCRGAPNPPRLEWLSGAAAR